MSGVIAMEGQLNSIVKEYLDYFGFDSTLAKFNEECQLKGKSIANMDNRQGSNQKINLMIVIQFDSFKYYYSHIVNNFDKFFKERNGPFI